MVYADKYAHYYYTEFILNFRNNHMGELRQALTSAVREKHRESVYILALSFVPADIDEALWFDYTFERVKKRGENHQTLTPGRTVDMEGVMR